MSNETTCFLCKLPITKSIDRICISESAHRDCFSDHYSHPTSLYAELIHAVESKYLGESRHETALRYIRDAERCITKPKEGADYIIHSNREEPEHNENDKTNQKVF